MCSLPLPVLPSPAPTHPVDFSLTFPPDPKWVRGARDAVRTALAAWDAEHVETAVLLTSEIVTNAVTASRDSLWPAPIALYGEWNPAGGLRMLVHDRGPGAPLLPPALPTPDDEHGRGLFLISLYATEWGVCPHIPGPGKVVWFTLK